MDEQIVKRLDRMIVLLEWLVQEKLYGTIQQRNPFNSFDLIDPWQPLIRNTAAEPPPATEAVLHPFVITFRDAEIGRRPYTATPETIQQLVADFAADSKHGGSYAVCIDDQPRTLGVCALPKSSVLPSRHRAFYPSKDQGRRVLMPADSTSK